jgi:hypothetical protein
MGYPINKKEDRPVGQVFLFFLWFLGCEALEILEIKALCGKGLDDFGATSEII